MKVKCPQNLAGVAGHIGPIWFDAEGVSEDISAEKARSFLAVFGGELVTELPEGALTLDMAVVQERRQMEEALSEEFHERLRLRQGNPQAAEFAEDGTAQPAGAHTRESLEVLADKGGIKAIREIAAQYGVKGQSIGGLITEVLEAQARNDVVVTE